MIRPQKQSWLKSDLLRIIQTNFFGDHNLGLYAKCSDEICLIGSSISPKIDDRISAVLGAKVAKTTLSGTDFVGLFSAINSSGIILPNIVKKSELEKIKTVLKSFGLNCSVVSSKFNCLGNLVLCNDKGAIVSKTFSKNDKKKIEETLDVESDYGTLADMNIVGSTAVATNKGCLVHRDAGKDEVKKIEDVLKVNVDIGTANFGSPFVGSSFFANSNGAVVGNSTTGPEVERIYETLGLK